MLILSTLITAPRDTSHLYFKLILWICKCGGNLQREVGISVEHTLDRSILLMLCLFFVQSTTPSTLFFRGALDKLYLSLITVLWIITRTYFQRSANHVRIYCGKIPDDVWQVFQSKMTISAVSFRKSNSLFSVSLFLFALYFHSSFSLFSHCLLSCALFFPGHTSSEAITLAAARQWPEISKEPGQAASTAGKAAPRLIS